jgi:glycosyltransferase involved in cell wall biosynthesis
VLLSSPNSHTIGFPIPNQSHFPLPSFSPEIALIICTYQRPEHLERCLSSVANQTAINQLEVIISDDGSRDNTQSVVRAFADRNICPVRFATQKHKGFRVSRVRNNGVSYSTASYLLFIDGDCVLPTNHVEHHLAIRQDHVVIVGDSLRLDKVESEQITTSTTLGNKMLNRHASRQEAWRIFRKRWKDHFYSWLGSPMRPRLTANNFALWHRDFERVNGFDENFVGWGLEDVDLQRRLSLLGLRFQTILHRTFPYHLWHPRETSFARNAIDTANREYYEQGVQTAACLQGLNRTETGDFETFDMSPSQTGHPRPLKAA